MSALPHIDDLSSHQETILRTLRDSHPEPVGGSQLRAALWPDASTEPLNGSTVLSITVSKLRDRLAPTGWTIPKIVGGRGKRGYRLHPLQPEATAMRSHIILDCDDVLLDWCRGFRSWLFYAHGITPVRDAPQEWDLSAWLGLTAKRTFELVSAFNDTPNFGRLSALPEAVSAIQALKGFGHTLSVLTSCSDSAYAVAARQRNLQSEFGDVFDRVICLPLGQSKADWLGVMRPAVWIEDNYKHALAGANAGHRSYVMRRSHNRADEMTSDRRVTWLDDWRPILSLFS